MSKTLKSRRTEREIEELDEDDYYHYYYFLDHPNTIMQWSKRCEEGFYEYFKERYDDLGYNNLESPDF